MNEPPENTENGAVVVALPVRVPPPTFWTVKLRLAELPTPTLTDGPQVGEVRTETPTPELVDVVSVVGASVVEGTVVRVEMGYRPPRGALGARAAHLFGRAPEQQALADLRALKRMMETGKIAAAGDGAPETAPPERLDQPAER